MTEEQKEQKRKRLEVSGAYCEVCGKRMLSPQFAHAIGQGKTNEKRFGTFFINSVYNGKMTCSLECNSLVDVGKSDGAILRKLAEILIKETSKKIGKAGLDYITDVLLSTYKAMGYNNV